MTEALTTLWQMPPVRPPPVIFPLFSQFLTVVLVITRDPSFELPSEQYVAYDTTPPVFPFTCYAASLITVMFTLLTTFSTVAPSAHPTTPPA